MKVYTDGQADEIRGYAKDNRIPIHDGNKKDRLILTVKEYDTYKNLRDVFGCAIYCVDTRRYAERHRNKSRLEWVKDVM